MPPPADQKIELRGLYGRDLVEALDMIALAKGCTRVDLVGRVLRQYVVAQQHQASLIARSARVTPAPLDSGWSDLDGSAPTR